MAFKNLTFTSTVSIIGRKRNENGKLVYNALNKDLKIEIGDVLYITFQPCLCTGGYAPYVTVTNDRNNLTKYNSEANKFVEMLNTAFEFEEI